MFDELQQQAQEEESRVGMAKLLGIFAGLVIVCALFFSLGYSLGKKSAAGTVIPEPVATAVTTTPKPSPSQAKPSPQLAAPISAAAATTSGSDSADASSRPAPEMANAGGIYVVQVAAVSRQEDAEALVGALRKKNYPVFVINNVPGDKLFHVQIGPYAEAKDAEAMKARLAGDGYNPILKK